MKDVDEIGKRTLKGISIEYLTRMEDVIDLVLVKRPLKNPKSFFKVPESANGTAPKDSNVLLVNP